MVPPDPGLSQPIYGVIVLPKLYLELILSMFLQLIYRNYLYGECHLHFTRESQCSYALSFIVHVELS